MAGDATAQVPDSGAIPTRSVWTVLAALALLTLSASPGRGQEPPPAVQAPPETPAPAQQPQQIPPATLTPRQFQPLDTPFPFPLTIPSPTPQLPPGGPTQPPTSAAIPPPAIQQDQRPFQLRSFVRIEGEYNDNVFLSERKKRDELREILTPGLSLRHSMARSRAEITYAPSLIHSSLNEGDVRLFHLFDGNGSLDLTEHLTVNALDRFLRTDEPTITNPRGVQTGRTTLIQNTLASDLTYRQDTWSLVPRYTLTLNRTEVDDQAQEQDQERSIVHALGMEGTLDILSRNTLRAGYELTLADFRVANDFVGHLGRFSFTRQLGPVTNASIGASMAHRDVQKASNFDIYRSDVGVRHDVSPLYAVEARVGYGLFRIAGGDSTGDVEYLLRGIYTGKAVRFTATSGQSFQETFLERENFGVTKTSDTTAEVRFEPADRLVLTLRGRLAENKFLQSLASTQTGPQRGRDDQTIEGGIEIAFRLTRLFSLTLGYVHIRLDSNVTGASYQNNRVRLGLTATYE